MYDTDLPRKTWEWIDEDDPLDVDKNGNWIASDKNDFDPTISVEGYEDDYLDPFGDLT